MTSRRNLQSDLLRRVSRSFYLSMRILPGPMKTPISLGYLLARASDTLADTAEAPVELRGQSLARFRETLQGNEPAGFFEQLKQDFAPHQNHQGERELIDQLPECFSWLAELDDENRRAVVAVIDEITAGQTWDVERFGQGDPDSGSQFAADAGELETYTYQVAGCVGEFWTRIGYLNLGSRFAELDAEPEMLELGRKYGQGLQLVNVLRDLGEDLENGRCYLPEDELKSEGWAEGPWTENRSAILSVAEHWCGECYQWLAAGRDYAAKLRRGRVRFATNLPWILARQTVEQLELAGDEVLDRKIKVSRGDVRRAMWQAFWK